jgi:hypothetical protein
VAIAWFTGAGGQHRALVAFSRDAGRTFGGPIRIDENGTLGRVGVEWLDDGRALVSWIEAAKGAAEFRVRRVEPSGAKSVSAVVAPMAIDRTGGYPRIARHGSDLVMAWTESTPAPAPARGNALRVRTAVAQVPMPGR